MFLYCPRCDARVSAKVIATHDHFGTFDFAPMRHTLLACGECAEAILIEQYLSGYDPSEESHWSDPERNWPQPELQVSSHVPNVSRKSIEESSRCIKAKAFTASAAMSGRALEGVCRHFETSARYLGGGIEELKNRGIIDNKLFEWSRALHLHRNIAAHADEADITQEDAEDLLAFVVAICDYIFVLGEKFNSFNERRANAS